MSNLNEFLNQHYGTTGAAAEIEKTAGELSHEDKVVMFAKLAADNGIDLAGQSDERLEQLFTETFAKQAGEMPPQFAKKDGEGAKAPPFGKKDEKDEKKDKDEKEEKEKKAAAEAEFQEKKAAQQKFEEADFLGRTMAHAYVNEMRKIAAAAAIEPEPAIVTPVVDKTAGAPTESLRDRLLKIASKEEKKEPEEKKDEKGEKKDEKSAPPWMKDKEASALNDYAAQRAVELVAAYTTDDGRKFDVKEAAERIAAVHTLGIQDDTKIASAVDGDAAIAVRALEFLERAGYPVNWGG